GPSDIVALFEMLTGARLRWRRCLGHDADRGHGELGRGIQEVGQRLVHLLDCDIAVRYVPRTSAESFWGCFAMLNRLLVLAVVLLMVALALPVRTLAQNYPQTKSADGWPAPEWKYPPITDQNRKAAPKHDLSGMWGPLGGHMGGVQ